MPDPMVFVEFLDGDGDPVSILLSEIIAVRSDGANEAWIYLRDSPVDYLVVTHPYRDVLDRMVEAMQMTDRYA